MTISDGLMIFVVLLAPFLAVFAQKRLDIWRDQRNRKLVVFKHLMATRGAILSSDHVQALNMIDLEFTGKTYEGIRRIWKEYLDHLGALNSLDPEKKKELMPIWTSKSDDLLASLLQEMGNCLGYDFDKVHLKRGIYSPQGHADTDLENRAIRHLSLEILAGDRQLPMTTTLLPLDEESAKEGKRILESLQAVLDGKRAIKYELHSDK